MIISTHITVDGVIEPSPQDWATFEDEGERYKSDQLLTATRSAYPVSRSGGSQPVW